MVNTIAYIFCVIWDFLVANLGGFVTSALVAVGGFLIKYILDRREIRVSPNTGWWEQCIYDIGDDNCEGDIVKKDYYLLKHSKNKYSGKLVINIEGTIRRKEPNVGRMWNVSGYLSDEVLTLLYRAYEGMKSRGCIYVKMQGNDDYKGFYLEEHHDGKIDKTPLIIRKINDEEKIKELNEWNKEMKKLDKSRRKLAKI